MQKHIRNIWKQKYSCKECGTEIVPLVVDEGFNFVDYYCTRCGVTYHNVEYVKMEMVRIEKDEGKV